MFVPQLVCVVDVLSSSLIKGASFKDWGCNKSRQLEARKPPGSPPRGQIDGVQAVGDNHGVTHHISGLIKRKDVMVGACLNGFLIQPFILPVVILLLRLLLLLLDASLAAAAAALQREAAMGSVGMTQ